MGLIGALLAQAKVSVYGVVGCVGWYTHSEVCVSVCVCARVYACVCMETQLSGS